MRRGEVLEKLCELATKVRDRHFGLGHASDCFCGNDTHFQFSPEVLEFILQAVDVKLTWEHTVLSAESEKDKQ